MQVSSPPTAAGVAIIIVHIFLFLPHTATAQDYEKWYKQSEQHFLELKQKAGGGATLTWNQLPDWTGIWSHDGGTRFDSRIPNYSPTSAKLTHEYRTQIETQIAHQKSGIKWDHSSN